MAQCSIIKSGTRFYLIHPSLSSNPEFSTREAAKKAAKKLSMEIYSAQKACHTPKRGSTTLYGFCPSDLHLHNKFFEYK